MLGCYHTMNLAPYKSDEEGAEHFRIAADSGMDDAQYNYGVCLLEGKGVSKNEVEGVSYLQMAADQDNPDALYNLAICHAKGLGVSPDEDKAIDLLVKASKKGHPDAPHTLTKMLTQEALPSPSRS